MLMKKRFKGRNKVGRFILKTIILLGVVGFSFAFFFKIFYAKINLNLDNEIYLNYLVHDALGNYSITDLASLNSTEFLLKYSLGLEKVDNLVAKEEVNESPLEVEKEKPKDDENSSLNQEPLVYLFNSHQTEGYKTNFLDNFNINNTVLIGSYILKEYLTDLGIGTIVEEQKVADVLKNNGWKYGSSYRASRLLLEDAKNNHPSLKYFIDIHRDAGQISSTPVAIAGAKYAKLMFVVGLDNPNYAVNLAETEKLNELLKAENVSLSRGIIKKQGKGVNGVYNQDFAPYTFLIEVGGEYNTIEEINNSLKILAKVLHKYITETENGQKET